MLQDDFAAIVPMSIGRILTSLWTGLFGALWRVGVREGLCRLTPFQVRYFFLEGGPIEG